LKQGLIAAVSQESTAYLKSRICDIIGELAGYILEPQDWPEIIPYTYSIIQVIEKIKKFI
jgi:hypothetical protein